MQAQLFQNLRVGISARRLDAYRSTGDSDFDLICKYLWNVELCESFYPALQTLEIALRNTVHSAAVQRYGAEFWFNPPTSPLRPPEQATISSAKAELTKSGKPHEADRIVAELTFGFWASMFDSRYDQMWHRMILPAFPRMPRTIRKRQTVSKRLNEIRRLRNRVFHHERISHWNNLPQRHAEIVEAIGWITPDWQRLLPATDHFLITYAAGIDPTRHKVGRIVYGDDYAI